LEAGDEDGEEEGKEAGDEDDEEEGKEAGDENGEEESKEDEGVALSCWEAHTVAICTRAGTCANLCSGFAI